MAERRWSQPDFTEDLALRVIRKSETHRVITSISRIRNNMEKRKIRANVYV